LLDLNGPLGGEGSATWEEGRGKKERGRETQERKEWS